MFFEKRLVFNVDGVFHANDFGGTPRDVDESINVLKAAKELQGCNVATTKGLNGLKKELFYVCPENHKLGFPAVKEEGSSAEEEGVEEPDSYGSQSADVAIDANNDKGFKKLGGRLSGDYDIEFDSSGNPRNVFSDEGLINPEVLDARLKGVENIYHFTQVSGGYSIFPVGGKGFSGSLDSIDPRIATSVDISKISGVTVKDDLIIVRLSPGNLFKNGRGRMHFLVSKK